MNVAIFGGSFDPPHIGHEAIIQKALQKLDIETLFIVPTYLNPFKTKFFASPQTRYLWMQKLLKHYPGTELISYEMDQNRPVPTYETIQYIEDIYDLDEIYLIIGADNVASLHKWNHYELLQERVTFVVATRDDTLIPKNLQKLDICVSISSTELRQKIKKEFLPKSIANDILEYYTSKEKNDPKN